MASFTITLEDVIEMEGEENIGLSDYEIYDPSHRPILNKKIIDHYYNQEIGQETISMFRLAMKRKMNEIMPAFNQQYALSAIKLEALLTTSLEQSATNTGTSTASNTAKTEAETTGETTSDADAKSRNVNSLFPQNSLKANSEYATSAADSISKSTAQGESSENQTVNQTDQQTAQQNGTSNGSTIGFVGHQPELIFAARQTIVNIDLEIVYALESLFMGIWATAAEYTTVRTHFVNPRW